MANDSLSDSHGLRALWDTSPSLALQCQSCHCPGPLLCCPGKDGLWLHGHSSHWPSHTCGSNTHRAPDAPLSHTAHSQSSITRTKSIVLVIGCPLSTSALPLPFHSRQWGLTPHLSPGFLAVLSAFHSVSKHQQPVFVCFSFTPVLTNFVLSLLFVSVSLSLSVSVSLCTCICISGIEKCFVCLFVFRVLVANHCPPLGTSCYWVFWAVWVVIFISSLGRKESVDVGLGQAHKAHMWHPQEQMSCFNSLWHPGAGKDARNCLCKNEHTCVSRDESSFVISAWDLSGWLASLGSILTFCLPSPSSESSSHGFDNGGLAIKELQVKRHSYQATGSLTSWPAQVFTSLHLFFHSFLCLINSFCLYVTARWGARLLSLKDKSRWTGSLWWLGSWI